MRHSSAGSGSWEDFFTIRNKRAHSKKRGVQPQEPNYRYYRQISTISGTWNIARWGARWSGGDFKTIAGFQALCLAEYISTLSPSGARAKPRETKLGRRNPLPTPISHVLSSGTLRSVNGTWRGIFDRLEAQKPGLMPAHCPSNSTVPNPGRY